MAITTITAAQDSLLHLPLNRLPPKKIFLSRGASCSPIPFFLINKLRVPLIVIVSVLQGQTCFWQEDYDLTSPIQTVLRV